MEENKKARIKQYIAPGVVILALLAFLLFSLYANGYIGANSRRITASSLLEKVVEISELSTAQFTYNGIAQVYKDKEKTKVDCSIKYNAKVKAGVQMEDFRVEIDEEKKEITAYLPEIQILTDIVDEKTISFIPATATIDFIDALTACEEDVKAEVEKSRTLFDAAEENLKDTIEALLFPLIDEEEYTIVWADSHEKTLKATSEKPLETTSEKPQETTSEET